MTPAAGLGDQVAIFEWPDADGYLLPTLFPRAQRLSLSLAEGNDRLLTALRSEIRYAFLHIDLTDTADLPAGRAAFIGSLRRLGIRVMNGDMVSTSKRRLQRACRACGIASVALTADSAIPAEAPVIVKTDRNYGGLPERRLQAQAAGEDGEVSSPPEYRICRFAEIPAPLWQDETRIIERFIENSRQLKFRCHVLGDCSVVSAAIDPERIARLNWGVERHELCYLGTVPQHEAGDCEAILQVRSIADGIVVSLRSLRRHLKLDFGTVDVVMDEERRCFPIDINTTPYWERDDLHAVVRFLRRASLAIDD